MTRHGNWERNDYTALRDRLIECPAEPLGEAQDSTGLFPSGWTPEAEDACLNKIANERTGGPFLPVTLDDLSSEG